MEEVVIHSRSHNYQDMYKIFISPINFIKNELDISAYDNTKFISVFAH